MTPTPKLRWIRRAVPNTGDLGICPVDKTDMGWNLNAKLPLILQQWWESDIVEVAGEWRDVPLEKEE